jgi:hypothetical protein
VKANLRKARWGWYVGYQYSPLMRENDIHWHPTRKSVDRCIRKEKRRKARRDRLAEQNETIDLSSDKSISLERSVLGSLWLYVDWDYLTKKLTREEKDCWADAVDEWRASLGDPVEPIERWWR